MVKGNYVYGLLKTKKNEIRLNISIDIIHYTATKQKKKLLLEMCKSSDCIYCKDNKDKIITIDKNKCLIILGRSIKQKDGKILIYQRKSNIERELIIEKDLKDSNLLPNLYMTIIVTSWIDEKEREIFKIWKGKEKVDTLIDIYKSNSKHKRK